MTASFETLLEPFAWTPQVETAQYIHPLIDELVWRLPAAQRLALRMRDETGTRLIDWIDHLAFPTARGLGKELPQHGFTSEETSSGRVWTHSRGFFPTIHEQVGQTSRLAIKVESVVDYLLAHGLDDATILGSPAAAIRMATVERTDHAELCVVERHGYRGLELVEISPEETCAVLRHRESFQRRNRDFSAAADGFAHARKLITAAADELGTARACDLFFFAEREYWQRRNRAGRIQKARQDVLGLGWANHDHHTYRSSREHFCDLIRTLELLGFVCRERFYGGHGAGWGAQVLEQPDCGIVIFADVDMSPEEVSGDFSHEPLPVRTTLATVGMWCRLHGEAFLQAGMHHLECQFDFDLAREQLQAVGVASMRPFTDFPYLKQAFTEGEFWPVGESSIRSALAAGFINEEQAAQFRRQGALGSHLEILQRNDGYKGFNQTGISEIILRTDPRRAMV